MKSTLRYRLCQTNPALGALHANLEDHLERLAGAREDGVDLLVLLHWNRHETTEPALEIARGCDVPARTVHYAGFTSLQVALADHTFSWSESRLACVDQLERFFAGMKH